MSRSKRAEERKRYEQYKDIRTRITTGQTTTFAERNWVRIVQKKQKKHSLNFALLNT